MPQLTYPLDTTGEAPTNLVQNEQHVVTIKNYRDFTLVIPEYAPFTLKNLSLSIESNGVVTPLVRDVDYQLIGRFITATVSMAQPVYTGFAITNLTLNGIIKITYQTIGGEWTYGKDYILQQLAEKILNPRVSSWEHIVGAPTNFPPSHHTTQYEDTTGQGEVRDALDGIAEALGNTGVGAVINTHINNKNNPHETTKAHVQLGKVENLSISAELDIDTVLALPPNAVIGDIAENKYLTLESLLQFRSIVGGGASIGDFKTTVNNLTIPWLPCNQSVYFKSDYPDIAPSLAGMYDGFSKLTAIYRHDGETIQNKIEINGDDILVYSEDRICQISTASTSPVINSFDSTIPLMFLTKLSGVYYALTSEIVNNITQSVIKSSTNLTTWTTVLNSPVDFTYYADKVNNILFVCDGVTIKYSSNGTTWTDLPVAALASLDDIVFDGTFYYMSCAFATDPDTKVLLKSSSTLTTWSVVTTHQFWGSYNVGRISIANSKVYWNFGSDTYLSVDGGSSFNKMVLDFQLPVYEKVQYVSNDGNGVAIYVCGYYYSTNPDTGWVPQQGIDILLTSSKYKKVSNLTYNPTTSTFFGICQETNEVLKTKLINYTATTQFVTPFVYNSNPKQKTYIKAA